LESTLRISASITGRSKPMVGVSAHSTSPSLKVITTGGMGEAYALPLVTGLSRFDGRGGRGIAARSARMTTRSVSRVWTGRVLRAITALALALALAAAVAAGGSAVASTPVDPGVARPAGPAIPAAGRPPVVRGDRPPGTLVPTATAPAQPATVSGATPAASPAPRALQPLPILPPLRLTPSLVPVPQSDAAQLAPTSVLVLGFGSVALAAAAMALRLLRGGR
jgi:hypothetical protein